MDGRARLEHGLRLLLGEVDRFAGRQKPRKPRGPSPSKLIAAAVKAGKPLTSITLPDGTVLHFGEPTPAEHNEWDTMLRNGPH